jgi:hypothetical protein
MSDQPSIVDTDENSQALEDEPLKPSAAFKDKDKEPPNPVPKTTTAWQQYYDTMGVARQKVIEKLAKQQDYSVTLQATYDMASGELQQPDEQKTYRRRKISTRDFFEIERRRGLIQGVKERDPIKIRDLLIDLYKGMAFIYLEDKTTKKSITEDDFYRISWVVIKAILDACNLSSVAGQVPLDEMI